MNTTPHQNIAVSDPHLERLFAPVAEGYLGADGIQSVRLSPDRVLWVFGDTLIGRLEGGRRIVSAMPRNTIAIEDVSGGAPGTIEWFWPRGDGGKPYSFFSLGNEDEAWFWPGTGLVIEGTLFLIGYKVGPGNGSCEAMAFSVHCPWMVRVSNPLDSPWDWKIEHTRLRFNTDRRFFGASHVLGREHLYLFGFERNLDGAVWSDGTALARIPIESLKGKDPAAGTEYLSDSGSGPRWTSEADPLHILFNPAVTEATLYYDAPRARYIATTYFGREPHFLLTTASALEGPWSEPVMVHTDPDHARRDDVISYTFRIHPHLSADDDEIVLSYAVNARAFEPLLDEPGLYVPKFVRIDLRKLPSANQNAR